MHRSPPPGVAYTRRHIHRLGWSARCPPPGGRTHWQGRALLVPGVGIEPTMPRLRGSRFTAARTLQGCLPGLLSPAGQCSDPAVEQSCQFRAMVRLPVQVRCAAANPAHSAPQEGVVTPAAPAVVAQFAHPHPGVRQSAVDARTETAEQSSVMVPDVPLQASVDLGQAVRAFGCTGQGEHHASLGLRFVGRVGMVVRVMSRIS